MGLNNDYTFTASVSTRPYRDKEQAHAGCKTMKFQQMELTPDGFLALAGAGFSFCYNFQDNRRLEENFLNTQIIIFDIICHCGNSNTDYNAENDKSCI